MGTTESYEAVLIRRGDGAPIDQGAVDYLDSGGYHFDPTLGGYVTAAGPGGRISLPASFAVFLPMHGLICERVTVGYNPDWFAPASPPPVWEELPEPWDGRPPFLYGLEQDILWFQCREHNSGRPFMARYEMFPGDPPETWCSYASGQFPVADVLAQGWRILATLGETVTMCRLRIDRANAARLSKDAMDAIIEDGEGCALQVGVETGRIPKATLATI